jgi:hypothetical protein
MPAELLVPAFALVLAANAILIALAIRMFAGEGGVDHREARPLGSHEARPTTREASAPAAKGGAGERRPKPKVRPARSSTARQRRRFSLPARDEDHERFNRSIATFLSGGRSGGKSADGE